MGIAAAGPIKAQRSDPAPRWRGGSVAQPFDADGAHRLTIRGDQGHLSRGQSIMSGIVARREGARPAVAWTRCLRCAASGSRSAANAEPKRCRARGLDRVDPSLWCGFGCVRAAVRGPARTTPNAEPKRCRARRLDRGLIHLFDAAVCGERLAARPPQHGLSSI